MKGKTVEIPDATVITATDSMLTLAVSDDAVQAKAADFTVNMKEPLKTVPTVGAKVTITGTYASYSQGGTTAAPAASTTAATTDSTTASTASTTASTTATADASATPAASTATPAASGQLMITMSDGAVVTKASAPKRTPTHTTTHHTTR